MPVTLDLNKDELRDKIDKLRELTLGLDNIHSVAGRASEGEGFDIDRLDAEELGEAIDAALEIEHDYTELLDGLAHTLEEALYESKPTQKGSNSDG